MPQLVGRGTEREVKGGGLIGGGGRVGAGKGLHGPAHGAVYLRSRSLMATGPAFQPRGGGWGGGVMRCGQVGWLAGGQGWGGYGINNKF